MGSGRVLVAGSVNVDVALAVESLPGPGVTIRAGDPRRSGGGKGANVAVAAARAGEPAHVTAGLSDLSARDGAPRGALTSGYSTKTCMQFDQLCRALGANFWEEEMHGSWPSGRSTAVGCAAFAVVLAVLLLPAPAGAASSFEQRFRSADPSSGAMLRWWWPGSAVEKGELVAEIDAIADAGYKGVEIADVMDGITYAVDPDRFGYGNARWVAAVEAVLERAEQRGLEVDLTLGAHWPAAVPGLAVDGRSSSKELAYGVQAVTGGAPFSGPVPAAPARTYEERTSDGGVVTATVRTAEQRVVSVTALRCVDPTCAGQPPALDLASRVHLTDRVVGGRVDFTPPAGEAWAIVGTWSRGTGQRNDAPFGTSAMLITDPESRVVDHFSRAGTDAFLDYLRGLLTPEIRRLLRATGGSLFEDSLELTHNRAWTPEFLAAFKRRHGYSLRPYLPLLANDPPGGPFAPETPAFTFGGDEGAAARVRHDADQTLGDLYLANHAAPMRRFARSLGLKYRAQPYGEPIDLGRAAETVDTVECESLGCNAADWSAMTVGSELSGHRIVSDELLPGGFGSLYGNTPQDVLRQTNRELGLGANQVVYHGFDYATPPPPADGTPTDTAANWPGFHAFAPFIPEGFGPRNPFWTMVHDTAGYVARTQLVLQTGARRTDVAVYNASLDHVTAGAAEGVLAAAGYSSAYVTPGVLGDAARRIREDARDGLQVIVVGDAPAATPGYAATAGEAAAEDAGLRRVVKALLAEPSVHRVATAAAVPAALDALGVEPAADPSEGLAGVRTVRRSVGGIDFYYLHNDSSSAISGTVELAHEGPARAVELDAWTGAITKLPVSGDDVEVAVDVAPGEAKIVAVGRARFHAAPAPAAAGSEQLALDRWDLAVDEWVPAGTSATATAHVTDSLGQIALAPWAAIPEISDAVGVGTHTARVTVPSTWSGRPAWLDLGAVGGSVRVRVNGHSAGVVDQLHPVVDVGPRLQTGGNTITVEVATTLLNRLRTVRPADFGFRPKQDDGLLGPVTLTGGADA